MIKIVNLRDKSVKYDLYIGRRNNWRGLEGSKWANPYPLFDESKRAEVLDAYRQYILNTPELYNSLEELEGKTLACWCFPPKRCHGHILEELLEEKKLKKPKVSE